MNHPTFIRGLLVRAVALALSCAALPLPAQASECLAAALKGNDQTRSSARAFDFYEGNWQIRMRQRKIDANLQPASNWVPFDATVSVRRVFQGAGFFEEYRMNKPDGVKYAIGTRLYNPKTNRWNIYWANKNDGQWQDPASGGVITPAGITIIYDDTWGNRAILTRYMWTTTDRNHPTWEQSFSANCGGTWISNWVMEFSRVP